MTNDGDRALPAVFRLHPAMPVAPGDRFDLPDCVVTVDPAHSPGLAAGPTRWPFARTLADEPVDLRLAPADGLRMFTATELAEGWCALAAAADGVGLRFRFDPALLDRVACFADFGGWRGLRTAILEPGVGEPTPGGWHRIAPGETFAAGVTAEVVGDA